jgi:hypothetical protein
VDTANDVIGYPPIQGAAAVAVAILLCYWFAVRWYDRQVRRSH